MRPFRADARMVVQLQQVDDAGAVLHARTHEPLHRGDRAARPMSRSPLSMASFIAMTTIFMPMAMECPAVQDR